MASTSTAPPQSHRHWSTMEEFPNWLEMPDELMANIFQRLHTLQLLNSARNVCTTWQRICKEPATWKVVNMDDAVDAWAFGDYLLERLTKQVVDLSRGELIDISIEWFGTDDLLEHIVQRSSKLKRLCLRSCDGITGSGLSQAVKRVPQLKQLILCSSSIKAEDIEVIGSNCPQLKSFMMDKDSFPTFVKSDDHALAIANKMPELRYLKLADSEMTNDGLQAILDGCRHLQFLDVRKCYNLYLGGDFGKLCNERVKDFKFRLQVKASDYDDDMVSRASVRDFPNYYD